MGHDIIRPLDRNYSSVVPHIYVVRIMGLKDRKALQKRLLDMGIQTGVHYQPNHWLTLYKETNAPELPVTDEIFPEILTLPLHPDLKIAQVEHICDLLDRALAEQC